MEHHAASDKELRALGARLGASLVPSSSATVVALSGELGAGKTTFAQGLALALGVAETVASPTYILERVYALEGQKFTHLIHMDAYRLKGPHEMRVLGWEEMARERGNLIVLEWPERVEVLVPKNATRVRIDIEGDGRRITIDDGEKGTTSG